MILLKGITGFYTKGEEPPIVDRKQFKQLCFSIVGFGSITFRDEPTLMEWFRASYRVLSCRELYKPVLFKLGSKKCLLQNDNELSQLELEQVAYWKPRPFGEIIFN